MEHNLPAYYWQWSSPAASTAGCEDSRLANTDLTPISKLSKCKQTTGCFALQGGLPISFLWKAFTDFYNLVCAHRGTNLPCNVLLIHKDGFGCTGGHLVHLEAILVEKIFAKSLLSTERGKHCCWAGHFYSSRKLLVIAHHPTAHLHITVLWANPAPGLLFPAHSVSCSLNYCN